MKMKTSLITANDLAERFGVRCQTVYLWVRQRRIPFYRVGRLIKFDELEVLAHFKVEVEKDNPGKKQTERRIATSRNATTIDPFRALRSKPELTPDQRRYRKLLGLE